MDDEHRLIARYAARLAADANHAVSIITISFRGKKPTYAIYSSWITMFNEVKCRVA